MEIKKCIEQGNIIKEIWGKHKHLHLILYIVTPICEEKGKRKLSKGYLIQTDSVMANKMRNDIINAESL